MDYIIGKSAQDNTDQILLSDPKDIWFHLRDSSSAHLILRNPHELELAQLRKSGEIYKHALELKKKSKYRKQCNLAITYTYIEHVAVTSTPGLVRLAKQCTIVV